jgi:hypothetical protein
MGNHQSTYSVEGYESDRCEQPCSHITIRHNSDSNTSVGPHTHCHVMTTNCDTFDACLKKSHLSVHQDTFAPNETFWKCINDGHGGHHGHSTEHVHPPGHHTEGREESRSPAGPTAPHFPLPIYHQTPATDPGRNTTAPNYADTNNALRFMDL